MRRPSIPPFDTYREYFTADWLKWFDSLENEVKQTRLRLLSYIAHASMAHNDLTGIQGGTTGEYYHLTSAEIADVQSVPSHIADTTIHFADSTVLHNNRSDLQGGGVGDYQHLTSSELSDVQSIPGHIADTEIHNLEFDELAYTYTGNNNTGIVVKNNSVTQKTIAKTYDSSDRVATVSDGLSTWTLSYDGEGWFTGAVKV